MTQPRMALVPVEPTLEMVRAGCQAANGLLIDTPEGCDECATTIITAALAASPNAGKVSREQFQEMVVTVEAASHSRASARAGMRVALSILGIELEGETE